MFYVYEWFIKETNEIFYVGKGTGKRYKVTYKRNSLFLDTIKKYDCESRIIKYFDNESDAFEFEKIRINELKAIGMCSCNIFSGGAGGTSEYWSDDLRKEYSEKNVMKLPEQRERMSKNNPMKNKETARKVSKTKMRSVIINDVIFESVKAAKEFYNVDFTTIRRWCKKGINSNGELCRYADSEQVIFNDKRYNKGTSMAVIYKDNYYEAEIDLCKDIGISQNTCFSWLKRGFDTQGNTCRYVNDDRELVFENRHVKRNIERSKPIIVNGVKYKSCREASEILKIPKSTLYSYLNKPKSNSKFYCIYDNQQPSQGNVDKSTLEGSTTNG